jgi:anti-sigma factor ChrR (cupin superfamily)
MNFPEFSNNSMRSCPTEDVLLDYIAGHLAPAKAVLFELHAEGCADCAALRTAQNAIWRSLDEWKPAPVSESFNRDLWRRIDAEAQASSWTERLAGMMQIGIWKRVAPLAVAMAVVVTAFMLDHSGSQKPPVNAPAAVVLTQSEADQLERALDDIQLLHEVDAEAAAAKPESTLM